MYKASGAPPVKTCSYCGRDNADDAFQCHECGTSDWKGAVLVSAREAPAPDKRMLYGALWFFGGVLVTAVSYASAEGNPSGGAYVVAYGAIIYGLVRLIQGVRARKQGADSTSPKTYDTAYDALACATQLEMKGQVDEALKIYQMVSETYPDTDPGRDALKSIESLKAKRGGADHS